jgi:hypothetical protein
LSGGAKRYIEDSVLATTRDKANAATLHAIIGRSEEVSQLPSTIG